jgi:acrylyl-CoA reductase (NADPH)
MGIGTAGYTAMLCVIALEQGGAKPGQGEVVVTGATGGVGSIAIALLSQLGFEVVAVTGKLTEEDYLKSLGASRVVDRQEFSAVGKPMQKERWAAAIDTAGSHTLANLCAQMQYGAPVSACGLAQGADLPLTVMPFILRGVQLLGIDSVMAPMNKRQAAWNRLATDLDLIKLESMMEEITLDQVPEYAKALMAGEVAGRIVVKL